MIKPTWSVSYILRTQLHLTPYKNDIPLFLPFDCRYLRLRVFCIPLNADPTSATLILLNWTNLDVPSIKMIPVVQPALSNISGVA